MLYFIMNINRILNSLTFSRIKYKENYIYNIVGFNNL
jgi:hypothetical protein